MGTNRTNKSYVDGVAVFIDYAVHNLQKMGKIHLRINKQHLLMPCPHGEKDEPSISAPKYVNATTEFVDDANFALDIPTDGPAIIEMVNATKDDFDEDDLVKFQELLLDTEKPLYERRPDFTKLSAIVKLLNLKGKYGASEKLFTELLGLIKKMLPAGYLRNAIDVFLEPLVDDLHTLFETGVDKYDFSTKDNFNLRVVVLWTINDYPALGTLCGFPYSRFKEKNVAESLVETLLHVSVKTKDGVNARLDLAELGVKPELFAMQEKEKTTLPPACYTLTNAKKDTFCETLHNIRVPQANRQILDGPFILNEMLQWCKSKKKQSLIFKVDFEKAYDSVRWDFLDEVLSKFGFESIWQKWIQVCVNSSRGSILINGSPTKEFQFYKGLKQGDPLSPFLFILAMESFHLSFQRVVDSGMFKGLYLNNSLCLSHMFYANDVIFVGNWSDENIKSLMLVLDVFKRASGLKINLNKSKIIGINVEGHKVKQAANKLGCLILSCPFSYLGSKVSVSMSRIQDWREVIEKVNLRLSKWKMKCLSIGGRLTLLKSVLGAMPIFNMSIFKVPTKVLKLLESIRGRFFNGHGSDSRKAHWIKWDKVLTNKDKGGLGVSSFFALNRGLMFKWVWRFLNNESSLWKKVIKAIHGESKNLYNESRFVIKSCWSTIVIEAQNIKVRGINIFDYLKLRLGNGNSIKFWNDYWYQGGILKNICPRMYALESRKDATLTVLETVTNSITLGPMEDRWVWSLEGSGEFSVASLRRKIDDIYLPNVGTKTK
nr:RNA-directed DNA polymerase, eukaryota [Tanacetum cinerariifolium]